MVVLLYVCVLFASSCVQSSIAAEQGYPSFGELAQFVYCLLQKNKKTPSLPLVEQGEEYVVASHSQFLATVEKDFLSCTRVMAALDKTGDQKLRTEFRRDARRFLEDFVNCILSTVASRSVIRLGLSCFCLAIVVGEDNAAPFQLFSRLLDGLLEKCWTRGSEVEACGAEYQFFVQEQRQPERSATMSPPDVADVLSFCSAQAGFRARRQLDEVCIVSNQRCFFDFYALFCLPHEIPMFQVLQFFTFVIRSPATCGENYFVSLDRIAIKEEEVRGVLLCVQDFVQSAHFTQRKLSSDSESVTIADSIKSSPVYAPWSFVESACASQVITDQLAC